MVQNIKLPGLMRGNRSVFVKKCINSQIEPIKQYMEENSNGCTAMVQEADGAPDDSVTLSGKAHVTPMSELKSRII